jgi:hypothetical protein
MFPLIAGPVKDASDAATPERLGANTRLRETTDESSGCNHATLIDRFHLGN